MAIYEYRCRNCQFTTHRTFPADTVGPCSQCPDGELRRVFSFQVAPVMQDHMNRSTGTVVSSHKQFARDLRVAGEKYTERTGIETRYEPVDMSDTKALGVTGEGLDATNRQRVADGLPAIKIPGII